LPNPHLVLRAALSQGIGFVSSASGKGLRDSLIEAAARGEGSFLLEHYGHQLNGAQFRLREILHLCGDDALEEFTETGRTAEAPVSHLRHQGITHLAGTRHR